MTCTHANQCDTVRKTTGMHGTSTKVSTREVPAVRAMAHQLVERYNLVRIRTYGCSRSQYTGTAVLVHRYPCTNVPVCNLCVQFLQKNHPVLNFRNKYRYCKNKYRRKYICHLVQVRTSMAAKFHKYIIQYNVLRRYFWVPYQTKYLLY